MNSPSRPRIGLPLRIARVHSSTSMAITSTSEETAEDWLARSKGARPRTMRPPSSVRDHDGVERGPALLGPVDVFEVDPQRELVEREARADAEERREDLVPGTAGLQREAQESCAQQEHDSPDEVMDVQAALRLDAAGPPRHAGTADQAGARANEEERRQERPQQYEAGPLAGFVEEVLGYFDVQSH